MASSGVIFDIQHYAVHDGPGIRTLVFLKGCPLACAWCCNPESQRFEPEPRRLLDGTQELVGREASVAEVMARVAADKRFYENSGGGATFSGGEPLAQPAFLGGLLEACREAGIRSAVETCGYAPAADIARLEPLVDLFLYDIKIVDCRLHERWTGRGNETILENLRLLSGRCPAKVAVRTPVVPGATDSKDNLAAVASLCASLGLREPQLLAYHSLGSQKYAGLGRKCALAQERAEPEG